MRPIACQPKKRLTRSRITADRCWISIAAGPSTRSTSVAGSGGLLADRARPVDLDRLAVGGDFRADDVAPAGEDLGRGKALRFEGIAQGGAQELRKRPGKTARGLAHLGFSCAVLCHLWSHDRSSPIAQAKESRERARAGRSAGLVRPPPPRSCPGGARRGERADPYRGLAVGNHAAADHGEDGRALLRALPGALADGGRARRDKPRRRAARLGRARLLRPRPQSACLRARGGRAPRRDFSGTASKACARCPASATTPRRRSRRSRSITPAVPVDGNVERVVSRLFAVEEKLPAAKPTDQAAGGVVVAAAPRRRFRASADGSRRHHLLAQAAGLRAVPVERVVRRVCARRSGDIPAQGAKARRQIAPRRGLCRAARRRPRAAAPAPGKRTARRHDRSAGQRLGA